ncbi:MAG: right-handed parallel beta-helix repeat-containing protein [Myxococcales bacterium]|nr:right-handed parallel beta-helix repeat-containing protein [Myxococcales bacterium]
MTTPILLGLMGCSSPASKNHEACDCPFEGHGAVYEDQCLCLRAVPVPADDAPDQVFYVDPATEAAGDGSETNPWPLVDWPAVDTALDEGIVHVRFDARGELPDRLEVLRTSTSTHRLLLDGRGWVRDTSGWTQNSSDARAIAPGIHTTFDDVPRSYVTVRGFEVTGSRDKGVYWRSGDHVVLEDLVVHDNKGTPAILLDYANRSGHRSASFVVRNTHVYDQLGECIYIGGAEGTEQAAHEHVEVVANLVHGCRDPFDTKHDAINIKDQIDSVVVERNVVFDTDWGIEAASPGRYAHNLVFDTKREGFQISDAWGDLNGFTLTDNTVIRAGQDGVHISVQRNAVTDVQLQRLTVIDSRQAGVLLGADPGLQATLDDVVLVGNDVGLDGWGTVDVTVGACAAADNGELADRIAEAPDCSSVALGDVSNPAGPDGELLTDDDPWLVQGMGARLPK